MSEATELYKVIAIVEQAKTAEQPKKAGAAPQPKEVTITTMLETRSRSEADKLMWRSRKFFDEIGVKAYVEVFVS